LLNKLKNDAIEIESVNEKKAFQHAIEKYKQMSEVEKAAALGQYQQVNNTLLYDSILNSVCSKTTILSNQRQ
jgi:hypothetical protein